MTSSDHDEVLRQTYDRAAATYDLWAKVFETRVKRRCLALSAERERTRILDVGVGTGDLFSELVRAHPRAELHGIDLSPAMVRRAKAKVSAEQAARLVVGNATALPYAEASFDLVVCTYVLELCPSYAPLLDELGRVLTQRGTLIFAGVTERPELRYRAARWACRRHPAWAGGLDEPRLRRDLEARGATVTSTFVPQRGIPAFVVSAAFELPAREAAFGG